MILVTVKHLVSEKSYRCCCYALKLGATALRCFCGPHPHSCQSLFSDVTSWVSPTLAYTVPYLFPTSLPSTQLFPVVCSFLIYFALSV